MSSKRTATTELTDRNWDQEEEEEEAGHFRQASDDVIGQRQIRKAKRRGVTGTGSAGGGAFKAFAGFTGFTAPSSTPSFSFGNKPASNGTTQPLGGQSEGFKLKSSGDGKNGKVTEENKNKKTRSEYLKQLKNLNESLSKWIKQHVDKNPYCILSPIFKDYESHLSLIEKKYPEESSSSESETAKVKVDTDSTTAKDETGSDSSVAEKTPAAGEKAPDSSVLASGGFTFSSASTVTTNTETESAVTKPAFSFGFGNSSSTTSSFPAFGSPASKPFSFAVGQQADTGGSAATGGDEEEYVPPIVEVEEVKEEGSVHTVRCKLFFQKDGAWKEKGLGNLHLKPANNKAQLIIRADTNLGNILLNILLSTSTPVRRQGKNNLTLMCVPNPPLDPKEESKPTMMLIRVKTGEMADELLEKINELKG